MTTSSNAQIWRQIDGRMSSGSRTARPDDVSETPLQMLQLHRPNGDVLVLPYAALTCLRYTPPADDLMTDTAEGLHPARLNILIGSSDISVEGFGLRLLVDQLAERHLRVLRVAPESNPLLEAIVLRYTVTTASAQPSSEDAN